jgi:hypothetical protein
LDVLVKGLGVKKKLGNNIWAFNKAYIKISMAIQVFHVIQFTRSGRTCIIFSNKKQSCFSSISVANRGSTLAFSSMLIMNDFGKSPLSFFTCSAA